MYKPLSNTSVQTEQDIVTRQISVYVGCIYHKLRSQPHNFQNASTHPWSFHDLTCVISNVDHRVFKMLMSTNQKDNFLLWYYASVVFFITLGYEHITDLQSILKVTTS